MTRRIAISFVILLAAAWALSYFRVGTNQNTGDLSRFQLVDGAIVFLTKPIRPSRIVFNATGRFLRTEWWSGFDFTEAIMSVTSATGTVTTRVMAIPLWMPLVLALALAFVLPGRRHGPGMCSRCGYDLRGANHSACPECGTAVPSPPQSTSVSAQ